MFISVHVNSHIKRGTARGTETLYRANDPVSERLARLVQAELVKAITLIDRRVWGGREDLAVFNGCRIPPAILVEVGFFWTIRMKKCSYGRKAFKRLQRKAFTGGVSNFFFLEQDGQGDES